MSSLFYKDTVVPETLSSPSNKMKSIGLEKSQFLNYLVNWEINWKGNLGLYLKSLIFNLFRESKKMRSLARATFKNPKISLLIGKNLEVHPKINTKNIPLLNLNELEKFMS